MNYVIKALNWLRITDAQGRLSLTNIALLVCLVKLALVQSATLPDIGALFLSVTAYNFKRHQEGKPQLADVVADLKASHAATIGVAEDAMAAAQDIATQVGTIKAAMGLKTLVNGR